jgi:hypothetical protein
MLDTSAVQKAARSAVAAMLLVAGCGSSSKPVPGALPPAIKKTEAAATGRIDTRISFTLADGSLIPYRLGTEYDNMRKLVHATADLTDVARALRLKDVGKFEDWRFDVITDSSRGTLVMYMRSPLFEEARFQRTLPKREMHKPWIKLDFARLVRGHESELGPELSSQLSAFLPGVGSPVDFLEALSGPASENGSKEVGGISTTRYRTTANFARHRDILPPWLKRLLKLTGPKIPAQVWVDDAQLVRRVQFTPPPIHSYGDVRIVVTSELSNFGDRIVIKVPSRDQVFDAAVLGP